MEILNVFLQTLQDAELLLLILVASIFGMLVGAIPGLTISAAMAITLPLTYYIDPLFAIALLYVMGKAGRYGGSIAAILFNTPGTTASTITQLDGYPLAQKGQAEKALKVSALSSVAGDLFGDLVLLLCIGFLTSVALRLGPPELFSIYLTTFTVLALVVDKHPINSIVCVTLGMLVSTIGLDPISGQERLTFGINELANGINLIPLMIGIFVISEVLIQVESVNVQIAATKKARQLVNRRNNRLTRKDIKQCAMPICSGSLIGSIIGLLPGVGSAVAAYLSYSFSKSRSSKPHSWGKGQLAGVASAESANNAVSGPSMIPLLTLGIPGSTMGTVLLSALLIHGSDFGPAFLVSSQDFFLQVFICGVIGILCYGAIGYFISPYIAKFTASTPKVIIYPAIFITCLVSVYSLSGSSFDVLIMLLAGVSGWLMKKAQLSPPIFIIAFILTKGAEESFLQTQLLSESSIDVILDRPIALSFIGLSIVIVLIRCFIFLTHRRSHHETDSL
ncbi:tripartite tricarboxylate transporter permease [Parashewanella tropica]|uniref:tripartite tricarboxylate transporter permease n=1 Tax=Parashewanella tropica TaxID=2547970 RepID=UPI00105A01C9|nr:tripartite tricarboxylate transporter permease [Parashewanella tropica]